MGEYKCLGCNKFIEFENSLCVFCFNKNNINKIEMELKQNEK